MNIAKEIDLYKLQHDAEDAFRGGFYCCEALMSAFIDDFELDVPREIIRMSSGMAVGVGKSGCVCGALNGGIMALGLIFGRDEPKGPADPQSVKVMQLTKELHAWFKVATGKNSACCRVLTREFDMGKGEHKPQCIRFTGLAAWKVGQIVARELGLEVTGGAEDPTAELQAAAAAKAAAKAVAAV